MKEISKPLIVILITIANISLASAIEFKPHRINGKIVYSNESPKCIKNGVVVCHSANLATKNRQISVGAKGGYSNAASMPFDILSKIKSSIASRYPTDYSMQKALINDQKESYSYLQSYSPHNVPTATLNKIKSAIESRYPYDFSMQKALIKDQVSSYLELHR